MTAQTKLRSPPRSWAIALGFAAVPLVASACWTLATWPCGPMTLEGSCYGRDGVCTDSNGGSYQVAVSTTTGRTTRKTSGLWTCYWECPIPGPLGLGSCMLSWYSQFTTLIPDNQSAPCGSSS